MNAEGFTAELAEFIASIQTGAIPQSGLDIAADCILDSLGAASASADSGFGAKLRRVAALGGDGSSVVVGSVSRSTGAWAALANGCLMHAEDFDDSPHTSYFFSGVLATAEELGSDGAHLLAAWAIAYETWAALVSGMSFDRPVNPTSVLMPIAGAVASGWLRGLDARSLRHAIGIAASFSGGLQGNFGTEAKPLDAGHSGRAAFEAAALAAAGWTAEETILEGHKGWEQAFSSSPGKLGSNYRLGSFDALSPDPDEDIAGGGLLDPGVWPLRAEADATVASASAPTAQRRPPRLKGWPCCLGHGAMLTALFSLEATDRVDVSEIEHVDVRLPHAGRGTLVFNDHRDTAVFRDNPATGLEAKFSVPYVTAAGLLDGEIRRETFGAAAYERVMNSDVLQKIQVHSGPTEDKSPRSRNTSVRLLMRDGRELSYEVWGMVQPHGEALVGKFVENASHVMDEVDARGAASAILGLEKVANIRDVLTPFAQSIREGEER